jgi:hypothetical protein
MTRYRSVFLLSLLLLCAQHGAMLHALGHIHRTATPELSSGAFPADGKFCQTCLAFAQAANPVSAALIVLPVIRSLRQQSAEPEYSVRAATPPAPRSRGPPALI